MTSKQRFGLFILLISYPALLQIWYTQDINTLKTLAGMLLMFGMTILGTYNFLEDK